MAEETMTRQQARQRFSRIRDKVRGHLEGVQDKLDYGSDYNNEYQDKVLEFSNVIKDYGDYYSDKIAKKEFEMPEISKYNDTTQNKDCCRNTDRFIQEKNNFVLFARRLYENVRVSTIETAGFVGYDMTDYIRAVESVADNLDRLIALLDDASSSSQDINNAITIYNQTCDTWESFKTQIKSGIRAKIDQFWQNVKDQNATAISVMDLHVGCHKNLFVVSFHYYDASDFIKDKIVMVEKDHHIDPDEIPTPKNSGNFKFLSWKDRDGNPFDPRTATITGDTWIEGKWKIGTTIDWMLDGESKSVHDMGEFEEGADCTTAVEGQLDAYTEAWGHMAVVPDIGSFDDLIVSRNNYEFAIKGYTKTFDFGIEYRTKTLEGWSGWTDQPGTRKKLRIYDTYDLTKLPINYQKAIENDYYINEPKTKKITYNAKDSDEWFAVTGYGAIRFDVCPLYKVRYQDEKGNTVKTVDEIEIGQQFAVDRHAPAAWPVGSYVDGNDIYRLKIGDEYTHKGETITASADIDIIPNYERINKATVIFSLNGKDDPDGILWGAKNHKYEDEDAETSFSTYSEINSPEYPSVLEAVMATATKPISTDDKERYENSTWAEDPNTGWYLGNIKITTGSLIKTAPGDNILVFKGRVFQSKLTVFCFSPEDKSILEEQHVEWRTETIDGKPYEGYITHVFVDNPQFPESVNYGPYYTIWGETVNKYSVNFCRLKEAYAGLIMPKTTADDDHIVIEMNESNNLMECEKINKPIPYDEIQNIINEKFPITKHIYINNQKGAFVIGWYTDMDDRIVKSAVTIDGKEYAVISLAEQNLSQIWPSYVRNFKQNADENYKDYPIYSVEMQYNRYTDGDTSRYELVLCANRVKNNNPETWSPGDTVTPIMPNY